MNRAAVFTSAATAVVTAGLLAMPGSPATHAPGGQTAQPAAVELTRSAPSPAPPPAAGHQPSSRDVALRFLRAYTAYEVGRTHKRALRATASRELARDLLDQPVRASPGAPRPAARVVSLTQAGGHGALATHDARLRRGPLTSVVTLDLVRTGSRWCVAAIR